MSTPSGPPYQTQSPTPWIVRGDRASSSAQPPPTVRSTNHPYPVTRKDTEDLLEQIADDFYKSAATLHEESESRITFRPRHNHLSKQEVLHSLAECAYNARNYSVSGKNTYHQRALESHTKACKLNQNGIATEEMNRVQSAAFSAFAFRHNNMPESMILPANSELPKEYFDKCIQRANNEKTPSQTKYAMEATLEEAMERSKHHETLYRNMACPAGRRGVWRAWDSQMAEQTDGREQTRAQPDLGNMPRPGTEATEPYGGYGFGQEWWEKRA